MNLIHRYSNTTTGTHSFSHARFYHLLLRLYLEAPMSRSRILQICITKLHSFVPQSSSSSLSQRFRLEESCGNGLIVQPIHHLLATVALILHPLPHPHVVSQKDEPRLQELTLEFNQIVEQLIHTATEEFQLDKSSTFAVNESEGRTNLCKRLLLVSMYVTVIYVRTVGIQRIQRKSATDDGMRVLMAGQIAMVLNNITVSVLRSE